MSNSPWKALDLVRGLCALPHVWEPILGEHLPAFKILCLEKTADIGGCVPCPNCDCCHRIVLRNDRTGAIGACRCDPASCPDIPLTMDQVTLWEVNLHRLGRALARTLGCQVKLEDLTPPRTLQFGSWSSECVPIILTIQPERSVLRRVIAELGLSLARPYILFAPTNAAMTAGSQELLAHAKAGLFTLDATVRLTNQGTLEAIKPAAELFAAFTPESELGHLPSAICHPPAPRYALRKGLGVWELYFEGRRAILKHERGLFYVHWLLYHPDETPIHAIDLMAKVPEIYRQQLGLPVLVDQSTGKALTLESHARLQERSLAIDDRQAMRAILKKQRELEAILNSEATEPEKAEALRELEEIIQFQKHQARRSKDAAQKAARAVRMAIARFHRNALNVVNEKNNPRGILRSFADYLENYLIVPSSRHPGVGSSRPRGPLAGSFTYEPPAGVAWAH